ncbi:hypothetical protein A5906_30745 [Bradyrhizobium sacchari]|nr:hypothetical protein A5906_30745 [Bradyrhizobium sacchari]
MFRPAQRATLIAKRKAAYEAVHSPANAAGGRASAAKQGRLVAAAKSAVCYIHRRHSCQDQHARRFNPPRCDAPQGAGDDLDRAVGPSLDEGAELDRLVEMAT